MTERRVINTVQDMRDYLDDMEKAWTAADREFFGEYKDQNMMILYHDKDGKQLGFGPPKIFMSMYTWIVMMEADDE